jgi:hypothetical protein
VAILLTNAIVPFDGDPIQIEDVKTIKSLSVSHVLANSDATAVQLDDGTIFLVREPVDAVQAMIDADNATRTGKSET